MLSRRFSSTAADGASPTSPADHPDWGTLDTSKLHLRSAAALVVDGQGRRLYEKRIRDIKSIASVTKLMTLDYGNTNPLVRYSNPDWRIGLSKTGYLDEAGRCLAMLAWIDGRPIFIVLLDSVGTLTPVGDSNRLRKWLESRDGSPGS